MIERLVQTLDQRHEAARNVTQIAEKKNKQSKTEQKQYEVRASLKRGEVGKRKSKQKLDKLWHKVGGA